MYAYKCDACGGLLVKCASCGGWTFALEGTERTDMDMPRVGGNCFTCGVPFPVEEDELRAVDTCTRESCHKQVVRATWGIG